MGRSNGEIYGPSVDANDISMLNVTILYGTKHVAVYTAFPQLTLRMVKLKKLAFLFYFYYFENRTFKSQMSKL